MYAPNGLVIVVDSDAESTMYNLVGKGVTADAVVPIPNLDSLGAAFGRRDQQVEARLRAGLPVVTEARNVDNATVLLSVAKRLSVPVTVVTSRDHDQWRHAGTLVTGTLFGVLADTRFVQSCDVIGDVHGQFDALTHMLDKLGHKHFGTENYQPTRRLVVFTGDTINKGPESLKVLSLLRQAVNLGQAVVLKGNNEHWLEKKLSLLATNSLTPTQWCEKLLDLAAKSPKRRRAVLRGLAVSPERFEGFSSLRLFLARLPLVARFHDDTLWAAHAAIPQKAFDVEVLTSEDIRKWSVHFMYGPLGENGNRPDWVASYKGDTYIVRGHVTVSSPEIRNRVISIDTGAGDDDGDTAALTALRWPQSTFETVNI